ncbi:MAG: choice-of-anchor Q domain-containing protein [Thermomicrobiales bacterium]
MRGLWVRLIGRGIVIGLCAVACVVALCLHTEQVAAAAVYYVGTTSDTGTAGTLAQCQDPANTTCRLRDALGYATSGSDTIQFNSSGSGTITVGSTLTLTVSVTIKGPTSGMGVTVSGGGTVGVFVVNPSVTASISNLTIANGNAGAFGDGGGILNVGTLTVTTSTFSGNSALTGGGIASVFGTVIVINSTFAGNSATNGAAIYNGGIMTVTNSTLTANTGVVGGGVNNFRTLNLQNTIVAGNTATNSGPEINGAVISHGHNLLGTTSGTTGITGGMNGDIVNPTPLLSALGSYGGTAQTVALLPGSPAIDAGDDSVCATTGHSGVNNKDQRGVNRPVGAHCDIGAFESQGFTLTRTSGDGQTRTPGTAFSPLVVTVTANSAGEPVNGGMVTFTAIPNGGASATLTGSPATIGTNGQAGVTATANTTVGSYGVTASAAGAPAVTFSLTNAVASLTSITLTPSSGAGNPPSIKVGQTEQFTAMGTYTDGSTQNLTGQVQWSSSNPQVATVDTNGKVTGETPGTVTLTASLNGVTQTITVTVVGPTPIGITVQPAPAARPAGTASTPGSAPAPAPAPRASGAPAAPAAATSGPPPAPIPTGR